MAHSFLGVGAPEAILVAVVALVVFGPKGLADVSTPATSAGGIGLFADCICSPEVAMQAGADCSCCLCCLQAAKSLGQTLRAFQPTIREVVEVSQEIKGTLEQVRDWTAHRLAPRHPANRLLSLAPLWS